MKRKFIQMVCLGSVLPLLFVACGGGDDAGTDAVKSVEQTKTQLEQAFQSSNPEAQKQTEALASSLEQQNYDQAYKSLNSLQTQTATNMQQIIAVEDAYRRLQYEVLEAMERGDPNAKRVWQQMQQQHRSRMNQR